jgi:RHS repeat-associated protein
MVKTIFDDDTFMTQEYDDLGRRVGAIDQNEKRTEYRYDDLGRLTGVKNALLDWTTYDYNEIGQMVSMTDAELHTTRYEYDKLGRRSATILPLNQRSTMTYDSVGNLKTTTDFNGKTITLNYDEQNRLTEKLFQDGSKVVYGYTQNNLQDTVTFINATGVVTSSYDYDYDVRDRLVKRTDAIGGVERSIAYGYDIASNMTSVTTASGTTTYSYDERNRLDLVKQNNVLQADYDYDAANRLIKTSFGNGTEETRAYDTLNRLKELSNKRGAIDLAKYSYTLDKVGNRKAVTETVDGKTRSIAYTYDDLYRLTDEAIVDGVNGNRTSHYVYDAVGNRDSKTVNGVTTTYIYDANDRLLTEKVGTATTVSYTYDNNGSTLTKAENGVTTTYTWNDEKRMVSATVGSTTTAEYVYNDQGIRVASKVNGVETRYLLDEGITANVWEEYATNGAVQASYVYGNDLITQTQGTQTSYYLVDGLGSTRLLTDTQGQVLNAYGYEAFGETVSQSGSASNKYQYAGEQFDAILGNYYLRQRFYDMLSGRFGRMDTYEGSPDSPMASHRYIYANDNPTIFVDPTGFIGTPPRPQPPQLNQGNRVHDAIGEDFVNRSTNRRRWDQNFRGGRRLTLKQILSEADNLPLGMPGVNGLRPDMADYTRHEIFEIKPAHSFIAGLVELQIYLLLLNNAPFQRNTWYEGTAGNYTPPFALSVGQGEVAIIAGPVRGVILYRVFNPRLTLALLAAVATYQIVQASLLYIQRLGLTRGFAV